MTSIVKASVKIAGERYLASSFFLQQTMNQHHQFRVNITVNQFGKNEESSVLPEAINLVAKDILIEVTRKEKKGGLLFKGVVSEVTLSRTYSNKKELIIKGFSPTIRMDAYVHLKSYSEKKPNEIVTKLLDNHKIKHEVNPIHKTAIPYSVQYQESAFQYMNRLAENLKEWCYYDGEKMVFGEIIEKNQTELKVGDILEGYDVSLKMMPTNFTYTHYNYKHSNLLSCDSNTQSAEGLDTLGKKLLNISEGYYDSKTNTSTRNNFCSQKEVNDFVKKTKASIATDFLHVKGFSTDPSLSLGTKIQIAERKFKEEGAYTITSIQHYWENGVYNNEFEALTSTSAHPPQSSFIHRSPICFSQIASVKENNDPDGLGRVRVQFHWQDNNELTPWIRVIFPHAGASGGIYFVPEVGEEVMIGFELGNPDRPYVMGSCYHSKAKSPYFKDDNSIKAISTKDGNRIILVDGNEGKISILNKEDKNKITLSLEADGLISIESEGIISLKGKSIELKAKNIKMEADQNFQIKAGQDAQLEAMNLTLKAKQAASLQGLQTTVEGQTSTEIKASASLKLDGGAMAELKAALVKIN